MSKSGFVPHVVADSAAIGAQRFATARDVALQLRPDQPIYCFRPGVLAADARAFKAVFPGKTAYAVKTNGEHEVLKTLADDGMAVFDVASPAEFAAARAVSPRSELLYMHPVKAQSDIRLAFETYKIRVTAVDHEDEVAKVLRIVRALDLDPEDFTLFVRIASKGEAAYELSKKFGAAPAHAAELLQRIDNIGFKCGIAFHVGSQVEDPTTYERSIATAAEVRDAARVPIAELDIGGGFPALYGADPRKRQTAMPPLTELMRSILDAVAKHGFGDTPLVAEPGRVVVARAYSLVARVLLKKGQRLYINDGIWSSLSDSWTGKLLLPVNHIPDPARRRRFGDPNKMVPFRIYGATCDSVDVLSRPFYLPETVDTGDWIEIGHIGAYSLSLRTRFNGFYPDTVVEVDQPFESADLGASLPEPERPQDGVGGDSRGELHEPPEEVR
ncbi:ornithine decarboxylase [Aquabacter spiritensis]|uniref:Ornithine decarboxylase n=1 Tax=Aquabacter spiritensis TaxID=933073 RepID=A0A4R3LRS1_9HYPH|nr:ornithine decarboxylase [Aquabacter spiritensis]TCT03182.1 ornithine decarboxylase [Aquabacter spiritensis]